MELDGGKELVTVRTESYVYLHTRIAHIQIRTLVLFSVTSRK